MGKGIVVFNVDVLRELLMLPPETVIETAVLVREENSPFCGDVAMVVSHPDLTGKEEQPLDLSIQERTVKGRFRTVFDAELTGIKHTSDPETLMKRIRAFEKD